MTEPAPEPPQTPSPAPAAVPDPPAPEAKETDWKAEARKWEQRAKDNATKLKEAEPILSQWQKLEEASKTELQRAQEQLGSWQARAEKLQTSLVSSRIEALASGQFADPSDAVTALDAKSYLGLEGQVDEARIKADLAAVLEQKPHWKRVEQAPATPRAPAPNRAQGSGAGGSVSADPAQAFAAHIQGLLRS